ncbi:MAG TPA: sulfatase-like hydrolase/transferase [Solirubrobacteraceae bacterium]
MPESHREPQRITDKPGTDRHAEPLDRRAFLKRGLIAGGALLGGGLAASKLTTEHGGSSAPATPSSPERARRIIKPRAVPPNILVVLVDQMRSVPSLGQTAPTISPLLGNLRRLSREGVSFARHYTASNDCTPARSTLLTGLYTHQTGCMITGGSTLDPGFPTWGTMLREHGYGTYWYGKWHLTHHDNKWGVPGGPEALARYGFLGGTYPSPDGAPGQGARVDPRIVEQFRRWFETASARQPWCTTVSLVNPHDIAWWYRWSDRVAGEASAARFIQRMPANFETPELLIERNKPRLQRSLQETAAQAFGSVPFTGAEVLGEWAPMFDLYMRLQREVDRHIGVVLDTLRSRPNVAANTVVVFTSDHGEYCGAHGLRGKGAGAYEEAIRVPLIVSDPRYRQRDGGTRTQLSSSVDVAALLLSLASGSEDWRGDSHYAHLAGRGNIAQILADPSTPGRPHVLHATDEVVTEFANEPYAWNAPLHVLALRTATAKLATYSDWREGTTRPLTGGEESELYDYRTRSGALELHNSSGQSRLEESLRARLHEAFESELRAELPRRLRHARERGLSDYFSTATRAAFSAAAARLARSTEQSSRPGLQAMDARARGESNRVPSPPRGI